MSAHHANDLFRRLLAGGTMSGEETTHAATCPDCQRAIEDARRLDGLIAASARPLAAEPMPTGILEMQTSSTRRWWTQLAVVATSAIAAIAGVAIVAGVLLLRPTNSVLPGGSGSPSPTASSATPNSSEVPPEPTPTSTDLPAPVDGLVAGPYGCGDATIAFSIWVPRGWFANPRVGSQPACRILNAQTFDPTDSTGAIRIEVEEGDFAPDGDVLEQRQKVLGDRPAVRMVVRRDDGQHLYYLIALTGEAIPAGASDRVLVAYTTGGDASFERDSKALDDVVSRFGVGAATEERPAVEHAANALFATTSTCRNPIADIQISYPSSWYTNESAGDIPRCSWFGPSPIDVVNSHGRPPGGVIGLTLKEGAVGSFAPVISFESRTVANFPAERTEYFGGTFDAPDRSVRELWYVVHLDRRYVGRILMATTTTRATEDYELAKAVLDRMLERSSAP